MADLSTSGPSAGSRRFWITVVIFALLNVGAWVGYDAWERGRMPRKDILVVQSFAPGDGEILGENQPAVLTWTFNLDVGKPGAVAPGPKGEAPGILSPAIQGEWMWTDARTLTFESHEKLPRATKFTATLNPAVLKTAEGYTLGKTVSDSFSTVPLELKSVKQAAFDGQDRILLELEFNDKVIPGEVLRYLDITGPDGKPVRTTLNGQGAGTIVRVLTDPILFTEPAGAAAGDARKHRVMATATQPDNSLLVKILPGLTGASGPLGIAEVDARQVPIANVLMADKLEASAESQELVLRFNNEVTEEMVEKMKPLFSVEPAVAFTVEKRSYDSRTVVFSGAFLPATKYTLTIGKVAQADDTRKFPRAATLVVFVPDLSPTAAFAHTTGYLGSKGNRMLLVHTVNVPAIWISAERVYENNLVGWRNSKTYYADPNTARYAHPMAMKRYVLANKKNVSQDFRVNLDELLGKDAAADGVYSIDVDVDTSRDGTRPDRNAREYRYRDYSSSSALVTLSDIGLTAKLMASPTNAATEKAVLAWAVSLSSGKPLADVKVKVYSDKNQLLGEGVTDGTGLVRVDHLNPAEGESVRVLIAESAKAGEGKEKSLTWLDMPETRRDESGFATSGRAYLRQGYEAFVWPERGVYRPGETVVLRAIVRGAEMATPAEGLPVRWQIRRPDGRDWESKVVKLDADGGAEWRVTFPSDVQTGYWSAEIGLPGQVGAGSSGMTSFGATEFQVEEFMPDRMKIALSLSGPGLGKKAGDIGRLKLADGPMLADVQSDYLFGQPAAGLQSALTVRIDPTGFVATGFAGKEGWTSGDGANAAAVLASLQPAGGTLAPMNQTLDKAGHTQFKVDLKSKLSGAFSRKVTGESPVTNVDLYQFRGPYRISVSGNTVETGGRAVTAYADAVGDALPVYLMVRPGEKNANGYAVTGNEADYELAMVSPAGEKAGDVSRKVRVKVYRETWNNTLVSRGGRYQYESDRLLEPIEKQPGAVEILNGGGKFSWMPEAAGSYVIEFADLETQQVATVRLSVGQEGGWNDSVSRAHPEQLEVQLVAADGDGAGVLSDQSGKKTPTFKIGENVKAVVRSPFAGELLLTVETDTVVWSKVVEMKGAAEEVEFALPEGVRPNGYVSATVIRAVDADKAWSVHRAYGEARFLVDSSDRKLMVKIENAKEMRPTKTLDVGIVIADAEGNPVRNSAVAVAAVDEGILRVTDYATPNPLSFYNGVRGLGVETSDLYSLLMPEVAKLDGERKVGGDEGGGEFRHRAGSPVTAKRVRPVSLVSDIVHTDEAGRAMVHLVTPEFLGQLRIMAVAYAGARVGSGSSAILVRSPLVVQSSFPRFLAPGDSAEVSLLFINNSGVAGVAHTTLTCDNGEVLAFDGRVADVTLAANEQKVVTCRMVAKGAVGVSHVALESTMGEEAYTEHLEMPVRPASPEISRGDYLSATPAKPAMIDVPAGMMAGTTTFELRVTQRPTLGLPVGLQYLDRYPYGCCEQTTSELFPLVYLSDIGKEVSPGMFDQAVIKRKVDSGITRLIGMQTASGGLSMWAGETEEWPWGSVYAAHFLVEAEKAGYAVPEDFKARLLGYVRSILTKSAEPGAGTELQAYAAYVMALAGKPDRAVMSRLEEILDASVKEPGVSYSIEGMRLHLALAWAAAGRKDLAEKLLPESLPVPRTTRELGGNLGSPVGDDALLLTTLLTVSPEHAGITQLVDRLGTAGQKHQWYSTQDSALAIMALGKYLRATKDEKSYETAELLDGEKVVATATEGKALVWTAGGEGGVPAHLMVRVKGEAGAKGHVSWLENGVPLEMPAAADHALKIRRVYLTEDGEPLDVGSLMSGRAVRVDISVETAAPLSNLVVEDLLPAGLEVENPRLATSAKAGGERVTQLSGDRLDVRDDRVVMLGSVGPGVSRFSYLARAVTPGVYVIPPVRGECMYDPAINSIGGGGGRMTVSAFEKKAVASR